MRELRIKLEDRRRTPVVCKMAGRDGEALATRLVLMLPNEYLQPDYTYTMIFEHGEDGGKTVVSPSMRAVDGCVRYELPAALMRVGEIAAQLNISQALDGENLRLIKSVSMRLQIQSALPNEGQQLLPEDYAPWYQQAGTYALQAQQAAQQAEQAKVSMAIDYDVRTDSVGFKRADESEYTYTASLIGPQGPAGVKGDTGPQGPAGQDGEWNREIVQQQVTDGILILADGSNQTVHLSADTQVVMGNVAKTGKLHALVLHLSVDAGVTVNWPQAFVWANAQVPSLQAGYRYEIYLDSWDDGTSWQAGAVGYGV